MNTAEMWLAAQQDDGWYECTNGDIAYSKQTGLVEKTSNCAWPLECWDCMERFALDSLMKDCLWMKKEKPLVKQRRGCHYITKEETE